MLYRLILDLMFTDEDPIHDILDKIRDHQDSAVNINIGAPNEQFSNWVSQLCHHDGPSPLDCIVIEQWVKS